MQQAGCAQSEDWGANRATSHERRGSIREAVDSLVYVELQPNNGGILLDLNTTGMRISAAHPLLAAKVVRFSFGLSPSATIEGNGQVSWVTESGKSAGIRFVDLEESSQGQIQQWLGSKSSETVLDPVEPDHEVVEPTGPPVEREIAPVPSEAPAEPRSIAPSAAPPLTVDTIETAQEEISVTPEPAAPEARVAPAVQTGREEASWPAPEWAEEIPLPEPIPPAPVIEESAKNREIETPSEILPEERGEPLPAPVATSDSFSAAWSSIDPFAAPAGPEPVADRERAEPEPRTGGLNDPLPVYTLQSRSFSVSSTPHLASQVAFKEFREFGWGLERDWHVRLGTLFVVGGFAALWQHPPMLMLGIGLWVTGGLILSDRKRPPADGETGGKRQDNGAN